MAAPTNYMKIGVHYCSYYFLLSHNKKLKKQEIKLDRPNGQSDFHLCKHICNTGILLSKNCYWADQDR